MAAHGCVAWTDGALDAIAARGLPVVEVGAGDGQWARALRSRPKPVDIVAYDDGSDLPSGSGRGGGGGGGGGGGSSGGGGGASSSSKGLLGRGAAPPVVLGVEGSAAAAKHPDRALLLVAPPPGPAAARWLAAYKGDAVHYAGEGRGGANADEEFFCALERGFRLVRTEPLKPFPGGCEKLWLLERKQSLRGVPKPSGGGPTEKPV